MAAMLLSDSSAVPYFPFRLIPDGEGWQFRNPLDHAVYHMNHAAQWLLQLCDGYRTWDEIVAQLVLGVQTFRSLPFVPGGRGALARELEVAPAAMRQIVTYLRQRRRDGKLDVAPMEFECTFEPPPTYRADAETHIGCPGAIRGCTITAQGDVLPCSFFAGVEAENVRDRPFAWIWEHSRFLNYFRSLSVGDIHGACQDCAWSAHCRGSCVATNFAHGDIFQSNPHCWLVAIDDAVDRTALAVTISG